MNIYVVMKTRKSDRRDELFLKPCHTRHAITQQNKAWPLFTYIMTLHDMIKQKIAK